MYYNDEKLVFDIKIAIIICLIPFSVFLHLLFNENLDYLNIFGIQYFHKYLDNQVFAWSFLISFIPFILVSLIFLTTAKGWRYFVLPLASFLFLSTLMVFTRYWDEYTYILKAEGIIWTLFFLENILHYDQTWFKKFRDKKLEISRNLLWEEIVYGNYSKLNKKAKDILSTKNLTSLHHYLCRIYHLLQILNKKDPGALGMINREKSDTKFSKSDLGKGITIILITALLFAYAFVPINIDSLDFRIIELGSFGFDSLHTFVWYACHKLTLLIFFSWFIANCDHWWKWSLLSPIIFYGYQFWEIFLKMTFDEIQSIVSLSPLLFLIVIIRLLSKSIKKRYEALHYKSIIEIELEAQLKEAVRSRSV